ncbi:MAG: acetylornithine deacetylase, partial [Sediminibacterium sp.]|nr:acetylornithine deacetylase [Sediminibacterium sp.]
MNNNTLYTAAVELLTQLIATPSFSKEEDKTALILEQFFQLHGIPTRRFLNNVWAVNQHYDASKPSILLNSHHDT